MRTLFTTIDVTTTPSLSSSSSSSSAVLSPGHSPVPYLFGGLAAMLSLIAFALLILAFSYWKISGFLGRSNHSSDQQTGDVKPLEVDESIKVYEEKFVVIMAGDEIPTFLATPICIKGSTFVEEETSPLSPPLSPPLPPSTTADTDTDTATATECTTDEMVHYQTENNETQEEDPDQHQTH